MLKYYKVISRILAVLVILSTSSFVSYAEIIHSERSLYRKILVEDSYNLRCLKFNTKQSNTSQSCFYKTAPNDLVFNYTKLFFSALLINPHPKRILIIGLGGGTMSNALHGLFPNSKIDNVEIDEAVVKVAREYFSFFENDNIKTYIQDGRIFIKRALLKNQRYDWIILDAFNGDYIPEHLLTQEFLQETKKLLSKDGVLTANTFSVSRLYSAESATYQKVFGEFYNVKNRENNNRIILTSTKALPSRSEMQERINKLSIMVKNINIDLQYILNSMTSTKHQQDWPKGTRILTDQFSPANILNQG